MTIDPDQLGGRLSLADPASLPNPAQALSDKIKAKQVPWAKDAGFIATTPDGRLIGPFNAFLRKPEAASAFLAFSAAIEDNTSLSKRIFEVVILAVGSVWNGRYEVYAHKVLGRNTGLSQITVDTLASGELAEELSAEEKIAFRVAHRMARDHRIDDALYHEAIDAFSEAGLVDIAMLVGEDPDHLHDLKPIRRSASRVKQHSFVG